MLIYSFTFKGSNSSMIWDIIKIIILTIFLFVGLAFGTSVLVSTTPTLVPEETASEYPEPSNDQANFGVGILDDYFN